MVVIRMLKQYPAITLYKGATSIVRFDLSNVEMNDGYFVLTVKKKNSKQVLFEIKFEEQMVYDVVFEDDFTKDLYIGDSYYYDIMYHIGGERFPQCAPSPITVLETVGGMING